LTIARCIEDFEILHGEMHGLSDTVGFLKSLSGLDHAADSRKNSEKPQLRERTAAAALFNWEVWNLIIRSCLLSVVFFSGYISQQNSIDSHCFFIFDLMGGKNEDVCCFFNTVIWKNDCNSYSNPG